MVGQRRDDRKPALAKSARRSGQLHHRGHEEEYLETGICSGQYLTEGWNVPSFRSRRTSGPGTPSNTQYACGPSELPAENRGKGTH